MSRTLAALFLASFIVSSVALADQDRLLPWSEVRIVSPGAEGTGRVSIVANVRADQWQSVEVEAYGKKYVLDDKQRSLVSGFPASSLELTYGGNTVSFRLAKLISQDQKKKVERVIFVSIEKDKGLSILGPYNGETISSP